MHFKDRASPKSSRERLWLGALTLLIVTGVLYVSNSKQKILDVVERQNEVILSHNNKIAQLNGEIEKLAAALDKKLDGTKAKPQSSEDAAWKLQSLERTERVGSGSISVLELPPPDTTMRLEEQIDEFKKARELFIREGLRRSTNPARAAYRKVKAVLVTGANTQYFSAMKEAIASVQYWDPERNILAFDLGLLPEERASLESLERVKVIDSPSKGDLKKYAWKPMCMRIAVETYGKVIWIDGGSDIRGPLDPLDELLEKEDHFLVQGQDMDMSPWAHPTALRFFGTTQDEVRGKYSFSGNLQGHVMDSLEYWEVLRLIERCSHIPECIAPVGSSLSNHRYDQIALSAAVYTSKILNVIPHTEFLAAGRDQLKAWNEVSSMRVFSHRGSNQEYLGHLRFAGKKFDAPTIGELLAKF